MTLLILLSVIIMPARFTSADDPRQILIFGRKASAMVEKQWEMLCKESRGLNERDVAVKIVEPGHTSYKAFDVPQAESFTVILVGRDGGEKYRSKQLTTARQFFALIDGMPMRRAEMKKIKNNNQ